MKRIEVDFAKLKKETWGKQPSLAKYLDIAQNTLSKKLNGHIILKIEELNEIAKFLGRHTTDFVRVYDDEVEGLEEIAA